MGCRKASNALGVDGLALDEQARAVAEGRELRRLVLAAAPAARRPAPTASVTLRGADLAAACVSVAMPAATPRKMHQQPVAAGVDDAGLAQGRQLLRGALHGHPAGLLDCRAAACRG